MAKLKYYDGTGWKSLPDEIDGDLTISGDLTVHGSINNKLIHYSWEEIADLADPENFFSVGDEKTITLSTSEQIVLQIYGFNHDDLVGGGKAKITFGMKDLMNDIRKMNSTDTNAGGWDATDMRSWCNGDLYNSLPSDLKAVIKTVFKPTANGGNQSGTEVIDSQDNVFLFSEVELFGDTIYSRAGEGSKYPIFTGNASRVKESSFWWARSPRSTHSHHFCFVYPDGSAYYSGAAYSTGVCFGFCV